MDLQLDGKVVVITGGASGIGEAIGRAFSEEKSSVAVLDRDAAAGAGIKFGRFIEVELTDESAVSAALRQIVKEAGRIDVLVNNAAVNDGVSLESGVAAFRKSLEQNLVAVFGITSLAVPHLRKTAGAIINIGSKVAETGQGRTSGYAASKGGVASLTREWALDLAADGIRVNAVVPAEVWTPQYERWLDTHASDPAAAKKEIDDLVPLGRRMTRPSEIADTVVFLASRRASHVTGQIIHVDGGYTHLDRALTTERKYLQ